MATIIESGVRITRVSDIDSLKIADDKKYYWGGDQNWYKTETMRYGGCGPATAANILVYLKNNMDNNHGYIHEPISKDSFLCLMEMAYGFVRPWELYQADDRNDMHRIYGHMLPASLGVVDYRIFCSEFKKMAHALGVDVHAEKYNFKRNKESIKVFIREGLEGDCPVALLNRFKSVGMKYGNHGMSGKEVAYKLHWVAIVGMREEPGEETVLEVLTWGMKAEVSLDALWKENRMALLPAGMVRFKIRKHTKIRQFILER